MIFLSKNKIKIPDNENIHLKIFKTLPSTNQYLRQHLHHFNLKNKKNKESIFICLAEQQTKGKGRLDRTWYSPFAQNLYFSCSYSFKKSIHEMSGLSLVVALSVFKTLQRAGIQQHLFVKWPNDIVYECKKISGSLIEIQSNDVIIGIGLNVNMLHTHSNAVSFIEQPWISMREILHREIDRNEVCSFLIYYLFNHLRQFEQQGLSSFIEDWVQADYLMNKEISLYHLGLSRKIHGQVIGLNDQGHLLLKTDSGVEVFSSGEVRELR